MTFHSEHKIGDLVAGGSSSAFIIGMITGFQNNGDTVEITWFNNPNFAKLWVRPERAKELKEFLDGLVKS
jgi:hypothetical protein